MAGNVAIASHYIVSLYNEVQILNNNFASYINLLLRFAHKTGSDQVDNVADSELELLGNSVELIRQNVVKIYIPLKRVVSSGQIKYDFKEIDALYDQIMKPTNVKEYVINRDLLYNFVTEANTAVLNESIIEILNTARNIYHEAYGGQQQ